jgi:glycosyltransferase involved in cell wall biosynthesis
MKVLHITTTARQGGGPEHVLQQILAMSGTVEAHVACPCEPPYWDRFREACAGRMVEIPHRALRVGALRRLVHHVRVHGIDVVHSHGKAAGFYARAIAMLSGVAAVHTPHGIHVKHYSELVRRAYVHAENLSSSPIDHIIHVSESERDTARALGLWCARDASVVENGVVTRDVHADMRAEVRLEIGVPTDSFVVMTASRFDVAKNMKEWAAVAALCPEMFFVVLGDGDQRVDFEQTWTRTFPERVRCLGMVTQPWRFFAAADAYLSTSLWEGLPLAVLEAMSMAVPVVASDVQGNQECVDHGKTGFLYESGQVRQAADSLEALYRDGAGPRMGQVGQQLQRRRFSVDKMASGTKCVYEKVLKRQGRD